jgi:hypothetical protein
MTRLCSLFFLLSALLGACTRKLSPASPDTVRMAAMPDSIPPASQIDIPITINLKPLYDLAERYVDKEFTSPGWPNDWEYDGCNTRYMYAFRRSPLQITASGNSLDMNFTGFYKVKGSQRGCIAGLGVTPWSPACTCGFSEPERRVNIGFSGSFGVNTNYTLSSNIRSKEPKALDECEVCFFKTNITGIVMSNIKPQLDSARVLVQRQISQFSLRPWFNQLWAQLQKPFPLMGYGYLHINPEAVRLNQYNFIPGTQTLRLTAGLTARPLVNFDTTQTRTALPLLGPATKAERFAIYTDARLPYDSVNRIINQQFAGTRIEADKGVVKNKHIIIDRIELMPKGGDQLTVKVDISGSATGTIYLTGKPVYKKEEARLEFQNLEYDIKTRDVLVKTAGWLLNKKITRRLNDAARIELTQYLAQLQTLLSKELNRTLAKGITTTGNINRIVVSDLSPQAGSLFIRLYAEGYLNVNVSELSF